MRRSIAFCNTSYDSQLYLIQSTTWVLPMTRGLFLLNIRSIPMTTSSVDIAGIQPVDLDAGLVFSGQPSGRPVKGFDRPCAHTPILDPGYPLHRPRGDG